MSKFGQTGKTQIPAFSIPDDMRLNWLQAIHKGVKFDICGCWVLEGYSSHNGYASITARGHKSTMWAHRISYALFNGPIQAGMHIDHKCRNPLCIRPDHLQQVTPLENYLAIHRRKRRDIRKLQDERQYNLFTPGIDSMCSGVTTGTSGKQVRSVYDSKHTGRGSVTEGSVFSKPKMVQGALFPLP